LAKTTLCHFQLAWWVVFKCRLISLLPPISHKLTPCECWVTRSSIRFKFYGLRRFFWLLIYKEIFICTILAYKIVKIWRKIDMIHFRFNKIFLRRLNWIFNCLILKNLFFFLWLNNLLIDLCYFFIFKISFYLFEWRMTYILFDDDRLVARPLRRVWLGIFWTMALVTNRTIFTLFELFIFFIWNWLFIMITI